VITVYCVAHADMYREALNRIISSVAGLHSLGQSGSALEGLDQIRLLRPDVVILDVNTPGIHGMNIVRIIRGETIPCIIVMVSDCSDPCIRNAAIGAGVDYFLDKFFESQKIGPILGTLVQLFSGMEEEVTN
jgi:two-component system, CitB family, response regulator DctR